MNTAVEWDRLLDRNSDLDGSPCELCEWSQADLMQLITMAEAELTMRHEAVESERNAQQTPLENYIGSLGLPDQPR